ncbi:MAG: T9SS type A sorting domain-containing protein [Bacteroidota bacterium]|nr:T9SS type A sorting domain-containing protein [Bacteroidota bacterium]
MQFITAPRRGREGRFVSALILAALFALLPSTLPAQGTYSLSTVTADNGYDVIMFDITALQSVRLHRFWNTFNTGTGTVEIWARSGGIVANDNTGWTFLGQATITSTTSTGYTEIPVDLDFLIGANEKWGFAIFCATPGVRYRGGSAPYIFSDAYIEVNTQSYGGTGTTNPTTNSVNFNFGNYPRQFCGKITYDEGITGPNDAGIASIDSPSNFCAGEQEVIVTLRNWGTDPLTSATIHWSLNGMTQPDFSWTGYLDTLNAATRTEQVTLGKMSFQSGVPYTITAWTTMPNGTVDTISSNDSSTVTVQSALAGSFTIGGTNPDYTAFADAVDDLNQFGVCGPVVFNVRTGTYTEQVELRDITGASAVNTVTFQSESGVTGDVTLTYAASGSGDNHVLFLNGASHVTFKDMTLEATGASYARVIVIDDDATDDSFIDLELIGVTTTNTSSNRAVVYSPSGSLNHRVTFRDCGIRNGSYGIYLYGDDSSALEEDVLVIGNVFTGQYYRPLYAYYLSNFRFLDNTVEYVSTYSGAYFAYTRYNTNISIERNTFFSSGGGTRYGVYTYNTAGTANRIVNNFVTILDNGSSTTYGLYLSSADNVLVAHNSVRINSSSSSGRCVYVTGGSNQRHYNNILYNDGAGYAMYTSSSSAIVESDFNLFHVLGSNIAYWSGAQSTLGDWQAASGMDANTITRSVTFADADNGDLHLAGASEEDNNLFGIILSEVTADIDNETRVNPYRGADEACYVTPGSLTYAFVDGSGQEVGYASAPGSIGLRYGVSFPDYASTVTLTVQFYSVEQNSLEYEAMFSAQKLAGQPLLGTQFIALPATLAQGTYRIEVVFNTKNSCDVYRDYMPYPTSLLIVGDGQQPCVVWPGDANNDGIVNYTDRRALNTYMFNANMRSTWLNGPARYRADAESNPYSYLEWEPQASAPWATPEGCHMDTDGNGTVNNLDYIAMKMNWSKSTPWFNGTPKSDAIGAPNRFDMEQNYPNPFNPATTIRFAVPESAHVRLTVTDALGRQVAELHNGRLDSGIHSVAFDASSLASGTYIATVTMTGMESNSSFSKTIKMALSK